MLVAQRRREVALLRAVGATRRQVLAGVLVEAGLIGLVSGGVGLLLGVGLATGIRALLELIGVEIPSTSPALETRTIVVGLAVGLLVTMVAAIAPAWAATRVAPMEALRNAVPGQRRGRRTRGAPPAGSSPAWASRCSSRCAVVGNQRWATVFATADHVRRTGRGRADPRPRDGAAGRPRTARRRVADGRPQHRPQLAALGGDRPGAHDRPDRRGRRRRDRDLAEGVGLGRRERRQPLRPDPRARRRRPRDQPVGGRPAARRATTSPTSSSCASPPPRSTATARWSRRMDTAGLDRVIDLGIESGSLDALAPGSMLVEHQRGRRPRRARRRHGHRDLPRDRRRPRCGSPARSARAA